MDALERIDQSGREIPAPRVVYAGTGPAMPSLKERAARLERVRVELPGRMDAAALVHMYEDATALIVPSTTHKEGNPLVIAEAMYAGTPVIASDQPPMIEAVGQAGIIVQTGNSEYLRSAVESLCQSPQRRNTLKEKALDRASVFSYEAYRDRIERLFSQ
jgi:glycosyltransferase involved in cell wall biosynthesis